jgi:hypothetical protein
VQLGVALRAVWRSNNFAHHKIAAAPHHRAVCSLFFVPTQTIFNLNFTSILCQQVSFLRRPPIATSSFRHYSVRLAVRSRFSCCRCSKLLLRSAAFLSVAVSVLQPRPDHSIFNCCICYPHFLLLQHYRGAVDHATAVDTPPPHHWVSCCQKICKIIFVIPIDDDVFQIYFVVQFRKNMRCGNKLRRCCCERADLQRHAHGNVALSVRSLHFSTDHFSTILFIVVLLFVCISKFDIFTCHYGS